MELNIKLPEWIPPVTELCYEDYQQQRCDAMNAEKGVLPGDHCEICLDKGLVYSLKGTEIVSRLCSCVEARKSLERVQRSGLADAMKTYTFEAYKTHDEWQRLAKQSVQEYAENPEGWLIVCGQVGSGKTHLCTAATAELMKGGRSARYMLWRDEVVKLKSCVNDDRAYSQMINPLKEADVLYIDDLFKTAAGTNPTQGDINVAFELINARYCRAGAITIFSCELTVNELLRIDEAVGSRIYQRTKEHCITIARDKARNYRLRSDVK